ncbi:hypothetical protein IU459_27170 [Nocardia amamiensis]|uniref:Uncharacterized protein n=1 Tax=Nocardia amamiensis TaxID=404578 RepID=A0ABS0D272_9NOCA|nr:hypothetical protein [Nocardia amamiensis]MBF6301198.1 hypothetical protein [Nocardia amamiensis]
MPEEERIEGAVGVVWSGAGGGVPNLRVIRDRVTADRIARGLRSIQRARGAVPDAHVVTGATVGGKPVGEWLPAPPAAPPARQA